MDAENVIDRYFEILINCKLFEDIGKDRLEAALLYYDACCNEYKKGDFLINAGEKMTRFGLVLSGCVQALADDIEGSRMIMANVTAGNSFGEALCYLEIPEPSVYIMASKDSEVLWLSLENLRGNAKTGDDSMTLTLRDNFTALLSVRTLQMNRRIQILSKLSIREKILTFLAEIYGLDFPTISDKDEGAEETGRKITVPMNREDMAAYIGTNRSALSRELAAMKACGIIDYHKNEFIIK